MWLFSGALKCWPESGALTSPIDRKLAHFACHWRLLVLRSRTQQPALAAELSARAPEVTTRPPHHHDERQRGHRNAPPSRPPNGPFWLARARQSRDKCSAGRKSLVSIAAPSSEGHPKEEEEQQQKTLVNSSGAPLQAEHVHDDRLTSGNLHCSCESLKCPPMGISTREFAPPRRHLDCRALRCYRVN